MARPHVSKQTGKVFWAITGTGLVTLAVLSSSASAQLWSRDINQATQLRRSSTAAPHPRQQAAQWPGALRTSAALSAQPLQAHPRQLATLPEGLPEAEDTEDTVQLTRQGVTHSLVPSRRYVPSASTATPAHVPAV